MTLSRAADHERHRQDAEDRHALQAEGWDGPPFLTREDDGFADGARVGYGTSQRGTCDVCNRTDDAEGVAYWDAQGVPLVHLCADCLAYGLSVALSVKMDGLMAQWRSAKTLKAARLAAQERAMPAKKKTRKVTNASLK